MMDILGSWYVYIYILMSWEQKQAPAHTSASTSWRKPGGPNFSFHSDLAVLHTNIFRVSLNRGEHSRLTGWVNLKTEMYFCRPLSSSLLRIVLRIFRVDNRKGHNDEGYWICTSSVEDVSEYREPFVSTAVLSSWKIPAESQNLCIIMPFQFSIPNFKARL